MNTYTALYPILTIVTGALLIILLEVFLKKEKKDYLGFGKWSGMHKILEQGFFLF